MPAAAQLAAIGNISTSLVFLVPLPVLLGLCLTALFIYIHKQQKTQRIERLQKHSPDEALAGKGTQARHPSANREVSGAPQDPNQAEVPVSTPAQAEANQAFPDRTFEALKQTYHKRRHAVEQKIEEEKASDKAAKKD
ncbi:hypothetical protein IWW34DRAFT_860683 [Fusarium oxysporum f. sp. albedinis]|nr:hypothetical protein IWW34DRAFT_860683 [Fusarium oxysporum f. sp. albedinis]KAK2483653.1 hypothetical protein H9L39_05445 [Fusarium oxysporum f. sp. albedinis]